MNADLTLTRKEDEMPNSIDRLLKKLNNIEHEFARVHMRDTLRKTGIQSQNEWER